MTPPMIPSKKGSEAIAAYYANNTARDTSLNFKIATRKVVAAGKKHGVKKKKGHGGYTPITKQKIEEMQALRDQNLSCVEIAKRTSVSPTTARRYTNYHNPTIQVDSLRNALHVESSTLDEALAIVKKGEKLGYFVPLHLADKHNLSHL